MERPQRPPPEVGLCVHGRHARRVVSGRGSLFLRCGRPDCDSQFPKYPPLPVLRCGGFGERAPSEVEAGDCDDD